MGAEREYRHLRKQVWIQNGANERVGLIAVVRRVRQVAPFEVRPVVDPGRMGFGAEEGFVEDEE